MRWLRLPRRKGLTRRLEVVVTDDGSVDQTPQVVAKFSRTVNFPVKFTTHPHVAFQLARCRNEGVATSNAPYLLFMDGDCVLPRNYVAIQLRCRRPGVVMAGDALYLDEADLCPSDGGSHPGWSRSLSESPAANGGGWQGSSSTVGGIA